MTEIIALIAEVGVSLVRELAAALRAEDRLRAERAARIVIETVAAKRAIRAARRR